MKKEVRAKRLEESNTIEVDASFFKNKIVCVWDDVGHLPWKDFI